MDFRNIFVDDDDDDDDNNNNKFIKYMSNVAGKYEIMALQKTAIFGTAHIIGKLLM